MSGEIREVPVWPSGAMRFDGQTLEVTTGDGLRVAASDLKGIEIGKARKGRLNVKVTYARGLKDAKTGLWVPEEHEAALRELVDAASPG